MQALYLPSGYLSIHSSIFSLIFCVTLHVTKYPSSISAHLPQVSIYQSIHSSFFPPSSHPFIVSIHTSCLFSLHLTVVLTCKWLPSWEHPSICGDISGCHDAQEWFHWHVMGGEQGHCSYTPQGTGCPASEGRSVPDGSGAEAEKACPGMTVWLPLYLLILSVSLLSLCICLVCVST